MRFYQFLKAAFIFAKHQAWADAPQWDKDDATALGKFFESYTGAKLKLLLLNTVLRQQANALNTTGNLVFEAGYCGGQRGLVAVLESLADGNQFTASGDTEADLTTP
jgi:hypothetical protein